MIKTRKQLLQELNSQMPENLSALEKTAYIANFVANQTAFDEHFWWGNTSERRKIYRLAQQEALTATGETIVHRKIICVTETSIFTYLARNNGIEVGYMVEGEENMIYENKLIYKFLKNPQHIATVVKDEQNRWIKIDVQKDMENWQTGCKPEYFGNKDYGNTTISELSMKEVGDILGKIGYAKEGKDPYTDDVISRCISENLDKTIEEQFEAILENERILEYYKNLGPVEAYNFTKKLSKKILGKNIGKAIKTMNFFVCFVQTPENKREYNFGIFSDYKASQWIYMFSKKQKKMIKVSKQEIKYMLDRNLKLRGKRYNEGRLQKFLRDVDSGQTEEKSIKNLEEEIMYDDEEK